MSVRPRSAIGLRLAGAAAATGVILLVLLLANPEVLAGEGIWVKGVAFGAWLCVVGYTVDRPRTIGMVILIVGLSAAVGCVGAKWGGLHAQTAVEGTVLLSVVGLIGGSGGKR